MASTRKTGKFGSLYLSTSTLDAATKFAHTTTWRFESDVAIHDCTRKGEVYSRKMPGVGTARLTVSGRVATTALLLPLADDNLATYAVSGDNLLALVRVAWKLITLSEEATGASFTSPNIGGTAGFQGIEGYGWVSRGSLEAPFDGPLVEDFEIQVDGQWAFFTTT